MSKMIPQKGMYTKQPNPTRSAINRGIKINKKCYKHKQQSLIRHTSKSRKKCRFQSKQIKQIQQKELFPKKEKREAPKRLSPHIKVLL